jgi:hypothetical protein
LYRADSIKKIIETGSYPYKIKFFTEEKLPSHRVYPCVEIVNVRPESERKSYDITEEINSFEVRVYIRYNRTQELETADLYTVENQVISLLKFANISDKLEITSSFEWSRGQINNNKFKIHGIQSTLTVSITEKKSTSGDGTLGGDTTISIGSIGELADISIIDRPDETHITNYEDVFNTARKRINVAPINETSVFFVKIEYSKDRYDKLYEIYENRSKIQFSVKRWADTQTRNGKVSNIQNGAGYDELETILFQIEILP